MSVEAMHDTFAWLAVIALAGTLLMVVAKAVPTVASFRFLGMLHKVSLPLAALVATTATLGSLWFSEYGDKWVPCRFCWYQRIFMYSSAVVLIVAAIRRDHKVKWYVGPLATIGLLLSTWHILVEHHVVEESAECAATGPRCAVPYFISFADRNDTTLGPGAWYGVTLAVMAFAGFAAILALLFTPEHLEDPQHPDHVEDDTHGEPAAS